MERARGEVTALQVEVAGLRDQLDQAHQARAELARTLDQNRQDLDDWRARHDALAAELAALRERTKLPWWRRLLPPPTPDA